MADFHLKIEWANKHVEELHSALDAFNATNPYAISEKRNPDTGEHIYYAAKVAPVSPGILLTTGDILQNLRTALDYLICHLVRVKKGIATTGNGFPIFENVPKTKDQKAAFARKVEGLWKEPLDIIDAINPYKGRNDGLWRLHELNIRDKHRLLLTAGAVSSATCDSPFPRVGKQEINQTSVGIQRDQRIKRCREGERDREPGASLGKAEGRRVAKRR